MPCPRSRHLCVPARRSTMLRGTALELRTINRSSATAGAVVGLVRSSMVLAAFADQGGNAPYSHAVPVRPFCLRAGHARAMPAAIVMSFSMSPTLNSGCRPPRRVQAGGYRHSAKGRWCGFPHDCMSLEPERRRAPSLRLRPRKTREFRHGTPQFKAWPAMARRPPPAVRGGRMRVCAPRPAPWPRWHGPCSAGQLERDRRRHRLDADSARATWIRP